MNDFKKIHDFLKYNYENGNFKEPNYHYEYHYQNDFEKNSDFKLGYRHFQADYECGNRFKYYPVRFVKIINKFMGNRLNEILDFMIGYNQAKNELK